MTRLWGHDVFDVSGRVVVITGGATGIGAALAEGFAARGARVVISGRRPGPLEETRDRLRSLGGECLGVVGDVTEPAQCRVIGEAAAEAYGRIDVLVNNAGAASAVPASRESAEEFDRILRVNLHGSYFMAQAALPHVPAGGSVINVSSVFALTSGGLPQAAYSSSKAGVLGLTRDLAAQWTARRGVRVNCLVPGLFRTDMTDEFPDGFTEDLIEKRVLAGRAGRPGELVGAAVFLASSAASYVTGAALTVDGGLLVT